MRICLLHKASPFVAALLVALLASGVAPTPDELAAASQWAAARFKASQERDKQRSHKR